MEFHENIKNLREDNDFTQDKIAKLLNQTQRRISRLETGFTQPTIDDIKAYCKLFRVSADFLLNIKFLNFTNDQ